MKKEVWYFASPHCGVFFLGRLETSGLGLRASGASVLGASGWIDGVKSPNVVSDGCLRDTLSWVPRCLLGQVAINAAANKGQAEAQ